MMRTLTAHADMCGRADVARTLRAVTANVAVDADLCNGSGRVGVFRLGGRGVTSSRRLWCGGCRCMRRGGGMHGDDAWQPADGGVGLVTVR
jgi:hypothetical protein